MRYLKPIGPRIELTTVKTVKEKEVKKKKSYNLLFTLDVIDQIQDKTEMSINEVMSLTTLKKYKKSAVEVLLKYLTGDLIEVTEDNLEHYSVLLLSTYIEQLKPKETVKGKTAEAEGYSFVDVERWFYVGKTVLGYPSEEVWQMTLGQLGTLEYKHAVYNGWFKEDKVENIDDVIPY